MASVFLARLRAKTPLQAHEINALAEILSVHRLFPGDRPLTTEGDRPQRLHILVGGWAARVKWLADGRRHLSAILMAGDLCDIDGLYLQRYDYGVVALSPCVVAMVDRDRLLALCDRMPAIARALSWLGFVDNALLNEAAASLARRSARQRVAHLMCELHARLETVGCASPDGYDLPLSQEQVGDALGLTAVHVNRTLARFRKEGLMTFTGRRVVVPDRFALEREAGFSPAYLHLEGMRGVPA